MSFYYVFCLFIYFFMNVEWEPISDNNNNNNNNNNNLYLAPIHRVIPADGKETVIKPFIVLSFF